MPFVPQDLSKIGPNYDPRGDATQKSGNLGSSLNGKSERRSYRRKMKSGTETYLVSYKQKMKQIVGRVDR